MLKRIANLPRVFKSLVILAADAVLLPLALWTAVGLRLGAWSFPQMHPGWIYLLFPLISIPIFIRVGLYRAVIRHIEERALIAVAVAVTISVWLYAGLLALLQLPAIPRGALVIVWLIAVIYIGASRFLARAALRNIVSSESRRKIPVVIYGAGSAGRALAVALRAGPQYRPVAFVDDNAALRGLQILGLRVYETDRLPGLIDQFGVREVLLAMPSVGRGRRIEIIDRLESLHVEVRVIPGMTELIGGDVKISDVREIEIDELLGRDSVPPDHQLLDADIKGKRVMITGAGGSIGSELCRQILLQRPQLLVLYEQSEFALYSIEQEILQIVRALPHPVTVLPVLGSVQDEARAFSIMARYRIQTVYHAAAYKHVPIVEFNITEGVLNNTFGTYATASAAIKAGVDAFVLISTDKAVRPTNVMGATKRMAELVLQAFAQRTNVRTRFSMVRFGNVLGSSGSVVPLFRKQIAAGGPISVTHPDITRYFMTIPEAAQLVIQAGAMGGRGEVFVLDMGAPVKVLDLARRMVHLSGFSAREEGFSDGEIEIRFTGLRPGEKLYEELLIGDNVSKTRHSKIMMANEVCLSPEAMEIELQKLRRACATNDHAAILQVLGASVSGFCPDDEIKDHLFHAPELRESPVAHPTLH
ncbi:polysaccharide biosynthesis protein [Trinickia dinghuensis]|uniref:Polysaccharide biosynthesis protein n=1 Tax=Trinickia dinghuensis TaxID=2291023 RepID=A0A3D8JT43_9BURK|nr:nucleoside-diphosphate sugar epimerase/dehydratase [Trinickia dinghuensis]RDU96040.1 polysaccharide biosynthesis protein [Trinickia dinghuensis]